MPGGGLPWHEISKLRYTARVPKTRRVEWTREHELIALNLYGKLPFGRFDKGNPVIIEVASRMGRTASSLAMKLSNLASLDPVHKARGITGFPNVSKQDREMWSEFHSHVDQLGPQSEQLLHDLFTKDDEREVDFLDRGKIQIEWTLKQPSGSTETTATIRVRRGQQFFRQTVLASYGVLVVSAESLSRDCW